MSDEPVLRTKAESRKLLRMADSTFRQRVKDGEIPVIRFGSGKRSRMFFLLGDLMAYIERHRSTNGAK